MSGLEKALRSELALAAAGQRTALIRRARELYRLGFVPAKVTPSQMNAVGELIRRAATFDQASSAVESWMAHALETLEGRRRRSGKARSWLLPAGGGGESLGRTLVVWIVEQRYLEGKAPADLDRRSALRIFWQRFHGFYRYHAETGGEMPLAGLDLEEES